MVKPPAINNDPSIPKKHKKIEHTKIDSNTDRNKDRIKIDEKPSAPSPAICIAIGAAISYYGYPFLVAMESWERLLLVIITFFALCSGFLRVLASGPFLFIPSSDVIDAPGVIGAPGAFTNPKKVPRAVSVINLLLCAGIAGFGLGLTARSLVPGPAELPMPAEKINGLSGILRDDPRAFNDGRGMGSLELIQAAGEGGVRISAHGKLIVFFPAEAIPRLKEFGRGSEIYVEGTFIKGNKELLYRASAVHILRPAPRIEQFRTGFRIAAMEKFGIETGNATKSNFRKTPVWAGLASALLLGIRDNLDSDLTTAFNYAGCAHILALSGMHLAILSSVITFLLKLFLGIRPASLIGSVFIVIYIFLAGAQPSLVRAGIIFLLGTLALLGFLKRNPMSLLALAFILQIFIQRESGISVSFILSYLALIGILWTGETVHGLLRGRVPEILNRPFSASLGAVIATLAVTVFYFGVIRPIGIVAGLLIIPLSSLFMILSLGTLVLVSLLPVLFEPLSFILTLVFRLMELIISIAGKAPGLETSNFILVLIISLAVVVILEFLKYLDNNYRKSIASFDN